MATSWQARTIENPPSRMAGGTRTAVPVEIDPMGAETAGEWIVHIGNLEHRSEPSWYTGERYATLPPGERLTGDYYLVLETDEEWLKTEYLGRGGWVSVTGLTRPHPRNLQNLHERDNLPIGEEIVNRWWAVPMWYEANDLVDLPQEYTPGRWSSYQLRNEAAGAAMAMIDACRADGINLTASSPYRSGERQHRIYTRNIARAGLNQRFSAPPGHSEHQLGTTVDYSSPESGRFLRNDDRQHEWMERHAAKFGWRQTYLDGNRARTGYIEEPWHWRYFGPEITSDVTRTEWMLFGG